MLALVNNSPSCSVYGNHRCNHNSAMFMLHWSNDVVKTMQTPVTVKNKTDSGSVFSQMFDSGSKNKHRILLESTLDPWPPLLGSVANSLVVLRWLCDSPWMGCAWRITPLYMKREQAIVREIATWKLCRY